MDTKTIDRLMRQQEVTKQQYAEAIANEMSLEDGRAKIKMEAVQRIMAAGDNPMTGKPHSFSSAEAIVNTDRDYSDYLAKLREAAVNRILAKGNYDAAYTEALLYAAIR
jgi:hypothetical protein